MFITRKKTDKALGLLTRNPVQNNTTMSDTKQAAEELVTLATSAGVKFPKIWGEVEIRRQCGSTMLSIPKTEQGSFDLAASLDALIEQYGTDQPSKKTKKRKADEEEEEEEDEEGDEEGGDGKPKKTKKAKAKKTETVVVEENRGLAEAIAEIASIYFKNGERMKGTNNELFFVLARMY